jgi:DNA-binding transcriptional MerR regulator
MIRIGDFSKLSRVTVKTLRFYDEMGLLKPVAVDRFTGYRLYEFDQLPRLYRILALKDLGFSLEEIGRLLDGDLSTEQMRGMLKLRQAEIRMSLTEEAERFDRVSAWLSQIEQENEMSQYNVVIKKIDPIRVAAVRGVVPTPPDQRGLWDELMGCLETQNARMVGAPFALYHDEPRDGSWDIEVCMPVAGDVTVSGQVRVVDLPTVETMACVVHNGSFATIGEAYDALAKWIDLNGYHITGPCREVNLRCPEPLGNQNDPNTVNEVQFPVGK